jgi:hypothetical protein
MQVTASRAVRPSRAHACGACGAAYGDAEWQALAIAERLGASDVRRLVRDWPDAVCIEVRRCARCGHTIAAKRAVEAGAARGR